MRRNGFRTTVILAGMAALLVLVFARFGLQAAPAAPPAPPDPPPAATSVPEPQQYPLMDMIANKIIQKYETSSCEQLWQQRAQPKKKPSQQEQEILILLRNDPQMRAAFINKIAPPIANKMFDCGMIP
ncbi:MAG TPA: hypothetical protein VJX29_00555 [Candidatus Acidoferrales bacterium]|nr:hypothetical protein [Candidatus Acidoferrales bacterium]